MEDCLFCKIIKGEELCKKIYEDEHTLAFLDVSPATKGHTLVVPKKHVENLLGADTATLQATISTVQKIAKALTTYSEGVNVVQNNKKAAGQIIFHMHFHVIPRYKEDKVRFIFDETKLTYAEGEAASVAEEIKKLL